MSWYRRLLGFALVRIVVAAAPIVLFIVLAQMLAGALHLGRGLGGAIVPPAIGAGVLLLYAGYVRLLERRRVDELARAGALAEAARGLVVGMALFSVTIAILCLAGACKIERGEGGARWRWASLPPWARRCPKRS